MNEPSATIRWTVVVLLIIAALVLLLPLRNLAETHLTDRIILATILLAICGLMAIWYKPRD
jgi:asparagine N-glycosylation enzyme membrane subunit Stt3